MLPFRKRCLRRGVRDMVRISDARISGIAYGTCVLHVKKHIGGRSPMHAAELEFPKRRIELLGPERRRLQWSAMRTTGDRGYLALYKQRVTQAHEASEGDFVSELRLPTAAVIGCGRPCEALAAA
jgi:dihydroxyacid dehydratase/phosphogluconate dehydratase